MKVLYLGLLALSANSYLGLADFFLTFEGDGHDVSCG